MLVYIFFFNDPATTEIYTLSLHDALPIFSIARATWFGCGTTRWSSWAASTSRSRRSEEHTSELQSLAYLVCRLLLEKKKKKIIHNVSFHDFLRSNSEAPLVLAILCHSTLI